MAGYQRCISLALVCLLLYHCSQEAEAYDSTACITTRGSFVQFQHRHFIDEGPHPENTQWWDDKLGRENKESFMVNRAQMDRVKAVCSDEGGRRYTPPGGTMTHLCISKERFEYVQVFKVGPASAYLRFSTVTGPLCLGLVAFT
ncbi:unnamed protein product [Boreogadus saida]